MRPPTRVLASMTRDDSVLLETVSAGQAGRSRTDDDHLRRLDGGPSARRKDRGEGRASRHGRRSSQKVTAAPSGFLDPLEPFSSACICSLKARGDAESALDILKNRGARHKGERALVKSKQKGESSLLALWAVNGNVERGKRPSVSSTQYAA